MKCAVTLFMLFLIAPLARCQDAKVIALKPEDSAEAKALYAQQKEVEARIADLRYRITKVYLTAAKDEEGHTNTYSNPRGGGWVWVRSGWGSGDFAFSEDFKFIVPVASQPQSITPVYCGPGFTINPVGVH
jgi:hypothetical protein